MRIPVTEIDWMPVQNTLTWLGPRLTLMLAALAAATPAHATSVIIETSLGNVVVDLYEEQTPNTVANFLSYVVDGDYSDTFVHRSVPGFVIQGGGFKWVNDAVAEVPTDAPIANEAGISNVRGTIAMAKLSGDPDSATSQWFINLDDNSSGLDAANGGYTVFGEVVSGMDVVDRIAALQIWNAGGALSELPLIDYPGSGNVERKHLVMTDVLLNTNGFTINAGLNDAWFNADTSGQGFFIVVYPDAELVFLSWFTFDTERPDSAVVAQLGEPGQRWLTAQGSFSGNRADLDIFVTAGGVFDSVTPAPESEQDGTMVVEFTDCTSGTISYDIPSIGWQGVIPIQRVANDNISLCEELSLQQ